MQKFRLWGAGCEENLLREFVLSPAANRHRPGATELVKLRPTQEQPVQAELPVGCLRPECLLENASRKKNKTGHLWQLSCEVLDTPFMKKYKNI